MEECESLDSEMTELQEFQSEASEAISQDDEDEVEELQNSLREVVQDQSVKPKFQCLMVDPSFSMVTVQSEDSGIVWETASSRCSTPWASETSSISEAYSMEGSGAAGKITIVFDEEKIVRRRTRSGGRSSRLGDRLSRPGSSRSASALGVERPEMAEVSLPNVKQEKTETEPDLEEIKNKDQQLFSLISEGYEILNIRVPSKLPTVDEEESTELQDNLSYLDETPKIRSRNHHDWTQQQNHTLPEEGEMMHHQEPLKQDSADTELRHTQKESTGDIDYFEKFTLVDVVTPGEEAPELQEEAEQPAAKPQVEEQKPAKETATDSPSASEDSFVFVTDVEIVGERLDEVFYGEGAPAEALPRREDNEAESAMRRRRESQRSGKENGSALFGSEETTLTPIYISSGPPKIIDLILLEEPTAMSFMYSDLYEDAVGERTKSDGEHSEAESVASEKTYRRRLSDSEEADGYLEKFILKDETPTVEDQPESLEDKREGRMMWSQSEFDTTGCLTRLDREEDKDKTKTEETTTQEVSVGDNSDDLQSATFEEKRVIVTETEKEREEIQLSMGTEEQTVREASEESVHESKLEEDQMEDLEVTREVKRDQTEPPESSTDEPLPETQQVDSKVEKTEQSEEHQREVPAETTSMIETEQPCQRQKVVEKTAQVVVNAAEETAVVTPVRSEAPPIITEKTFSKEAAADTEMVAADEKVVTEAIAKAPAEAKDLETERQETVTSTEQAETTSIIETEQSCQTQKAVEKTAQVVVNAAEETAVVTPVSSEAPPIITEKSLSEEAAADTEMVAADEKVVTEAIAKAPAEVKEPETDRQEIVTSTESAETTSIIETEQPCQTQKVVEKNTQVAVNAAEETAVVTPVSSEAPPIITEKSLSEEAAADTEMVAVDEKVVTEAIAKAPAEVKEPEIDRQEMLTSTEIESSAETTLKEALEVVPEDVAPVEVTTDCDSAVQALVEVTEKAADEREIQTQVQIDLREVTSVETTDVHTAEGEEEQEALAEESTVESQPSEFITEADQESDVKAGISNEVTEPVLPEEVKTDSDKKQLKILESKQHQKEESVTDNELITEAKDKNPTEDTVAQGMVNVGDEFILLVPKGQAVEMDIAISQSSEKTTGDTVALSEPDSTCEHLIAPETTTTCPDTLQAPNVETMTEPQLEIKPDIVLNEDALPRNELDRRYSPPAHVEEANTEEQRMDWDFEEDEGNLSPLRSCTPQEDLSGLQRENTKSGTADVEQKADIHKVEDAPETSIVTEDFSPEIDLHREDVEEKIEQDEAVAEAPEVIAEELEYEIISKQDAKDMPEPETQRDAEEPKPESGQEREERMEVETEEKVLDLPPEEELIEADYEIIDAEEQSQARLAAELQGMDWFCITCGCLLAEDDYVSGEHHGHEVAAVDQAYEEIKEKLSDWISELQGRSENIEDLVSELELAYNSVEDQCVESEAAMRVQNEEMMALVMEQYNDMSVSMEEEKKAKLEQLYDQIVSFQESIDFTKATLETTAREADTDARSPEDIHASLKAALDSAMSLELGPKGLLVFEDYAKGNTSSSHLAQRKGIPVPQRPTLQPQESGSATSTSVTVYWRVNPGDIIDCFQVYCMEDPQGAVSEEYRVTVKESYCVLEELEPDRTYKVWVMAVNYTGCSLPSERLSFRTAPSVPVIDTERCTVMWDSATLRWSSASQTPEHSYTLEYCRQYELEGEGLRSLTGIKSCEQRVLLQPNENYLFYIKAVNESGASEQSEAALISTKGTRFHLLKASAHPALELSVDQTTLHYSQDAHKNTPSTDNECPSILGELLPAQGHYYWETLVSGSTAYRLGVAYSTANRSSPLGENSLSWCLQCIPTPSGYQLLHNEVQSSVFVIEMPERVGTLLDYQRGRLSFYNAQSGQLLGTFCQRFTQPCHPTLALEMPGSLEVSMVLEVPEFTKDS
ncbi:cardiomyopathy-associated protein 5 isoform X2 [Perca flavescens]|uniref:cardiomyopathy-associated protein 5 isoform X2 n=1 Tax=Perca flavescens TaxID=8167 RepID=UPI00106EC8B0|nr:cardiomyopathy-associated protein 5-like isoform X2 [Perca flavescens]